MPRSTLHGLTVLSTPSGSFQYTSFALLLLALVQEGLPKYRKALWGALPYLGSDGKPKWQSPAVVQEVIVLRAS